MDASVLDTIQKAPFENYTLREQRVHVIDVTASGFTGLKSVATHNLIAIPKGKVLVAATVVVETAVTSGGNATLQFKIGSDTLTDALAKTVFAAGEVVKLDIDQTAAYAKAAADTLDLAVGTAALTAGKLIIIVEFVDIDAVLNRG